MSEEKLKKLTKALSAAGFDIISYNEERNGYYYLEINLKIISSNERDNRAAS